MDLSADFRYDLRVEGADRFTLDDIWKTIEDMHLADYIGRVENDPSLFSSTAVYGSGSLDFRTVEKELGILARKYPDLLFTLEAEDVEDYSHSYKLRFSGDTQERSKVQVSWSDFVPVQQAELSPTKQEALSLFDHMNRIYEEHGNAYCIARNLHFLVQHLDNDEPIPFDTLYQLAEKFHTCDQEACNPLMTEEKLAAFCDILENGIDFYKDNEDFHLPANQVPAFMLQCSSIPFSIVIEHKAFENLDHLGEDNFGFSIDSNEMKLFSNDMKKFLDAQEKPALSDMLQDIKERKNAKQEDYKDHCLREALEENDLVSVPMEVARDVVSEMGTGLLTDKLAIEFTNYVLKDRPEWSSYDPFELGEILFKDYCHRLDMHEELQHKNSGFERQDDITLI